MYNNIESTVLNHFSTGKYFNLQRGIWHIFAIFAYLFITELETLANRLRNDLNIKGVKIDNKEIKIHLLADDMTIILLELNSVKTSLKVLEC